MLKHVKACSTSLTLLSLCKITFLFVTSKILPHLKPNFSGPFLLHPLRSLTCQRWMCQMTRHQKVPRQLFPATWTSLVPWRKKVDVPSDQLEKMICSEKKCEWCFLWLLWLLWYLVIVVCLCSPWFRFWHWWDVELFYWYCCRCARYYFPNSQRLGPDSQKMDVDYLIVSRHVKSPLWFWYFLDLPSGTPFEAARNKQLEPEWCNWSFKTWHIPHWHGITWSYLQILSYFYVGNHLIFTSLFLKINSHQLSETHQKH